MPLSHYQKPHHYKKTVIRTLHMDYLTYLPVDYYKYHGKKWPLIFYLHGAAMRGDNVELLKQNGFPKLLEQNEIPFIVISPQCPKGRYWSKDILIYLLKDVQKKYNVDKNHIYLTGNSMGGYATWTLAMELPNKFAAIVPISGGGATKKVQRIKDLPVWVFHGAKDTVVNISESQEMVDALMECGGNVKFSVFQNKGHDIMNDVYRNEELYKWLLQQSRKKTRGIKPKKTKIPKPN